MSIAKSVKALVDVAPTSEWNIDSGRRVTGWVIDLVWNTYVHRPSKMRIEWTNYYGWQVNGVKVSFIDGFRLKRVMRALVKKQASEALLTVGQDSQKETSADKWERTKAMRPKSVTDQDWS